MPELKCTVETCIHNKQCYCNKNYIEVNGGKTAQSKDDTSCGSFKDYAIDNYSNSSKGATLMSDIGCNAIKCMYNVNNMCEAGIVQVQGSNACHSGDTECASFVEKHFV